MFMNIKNKQKNIMLYNILFWFKKKYFCMVLIIKILFFEASMIDFKHTMKWLLRRLKKQDWEDKIDKIGKKDWIDWENKIEEKPASSEQ